MVIFNKAQNYGRGIECTSLFNTLAVKPKVFMLNFYPTSCILASLLISKSLGSLSFFLFPLLHCACSQILVMRIASCYVYLSESFYSLHLCDLKYIPRISMYVNCSIFFNPLPLFFFLSLSKSIAEWHGNSFSTSHFFCILILIFTYFMRAYSTDELHYCLDMMVMH